MRVTDSNKTIDSSIYIVPAKSNGISLIDTSNVTDMSQLFSGFKNLIMIQQLDTSKATNMSSMFNGCSSLSEIPQLDIPNVTNMSSTFSNCTSLTEIPQFNMPKVVNMSYTFNGCSNLTTIPQLNTSKVTTMVFCFSNCPNLSDDSLNNILGMCSSTTNYAKTKTLKHIGLSSEQATKCTTLSNYQSFLNAGWTTGY